MSNIDLGNIEHIKEIMDAFITHSSIEELRLEQLSTGNSLGMKKPQKLQGIILQPLPVQPCDSQTKHNGHHKLIEVKSSVVGTFTLGYSNGGQKNKIKKGDRISYKQLLGKILHLRDILEPLEAPCAGQIVEIFVEDDSSVDYGQLLFTVKEAAQPP